MKKRISFLLLIGIVLTSAHCSDGKNKFQLEVDKEDAAVKLVREVQRAGYNVVTTAELNNWINSKHPGPDRLCYN